VQLGDAHKELIQPATLRELHTPQMAIAALPAEPDFGPASYAMGWVVDTYRGHLRIWHNGAIDGFTAEVALFPNDDVAVAAFANSDGSGLPDVLSLHAADRALALPPKDWSGMRLARRAAARAAQKNAAAKKEATRKNAPASHPLDDYAGDYENHGYGTLHIARNGEALTATYNGVVAPLQHWHYDVWSPMKTDDPLLENLKFKFDTDFDGNVAAVEVPFEPAVAAAVFTKKPDAKLSDPAVLQRYTGKYLMGPTLLAVDLRGDHLVLTLATQAPRKLVPAIDGWFDVDGLSGFRVQFNGDTLAFSQPSGLFEAKRQ
jgi:hypothetical protein